MMQRESCDVGPSRCDAVSFPVSSPVVTPIPAIDHRLQIVNETPTTIRRRFRDALDLSRTIATFNDAAIPLFPPIVSFSA
jgi:hypothetical protein